MGRCQSLNWGKKEALRPHGCDEMTPKQIIRRWGDNNLVRIPASLLDMTDLPEAAKDFLAQVGFPRRLPVLGGWTYEALCIAPPGSAGSERRMLQRLPDSPFLLLAGCQGQDRFICITEGPGTVGFVDVAPGEPDEAFLFINSSVQYLLEFQLLWDSFIGSEEDDRGFTQTMFRGLERRLERIDPAAFEGVGYYWPVVSEDFTNHYVE